MIELSDSEIYIMNIIWDNGQATSFDILEKIKENKKFSENTIRTLLIRMVKKKAIYIHEKYGKIYVYKVLINQKEFLRKKLNYFLKNIYKESLEYMILSFIEEKLLTKNDIANLLKVMDKNNEY